MLKLAIASFVLVVAQPALAQGGNLGFEQPSRDNPDRPQDWTVRGAAEVALDSNAYEGRRSLRLIRSRAGSSAGVSQSLAVAELHATRVRLSGYVRTRDATGGSAGFSMVLWDAAGLPLYIESMTGAGATGTQDWTRYEIELPVPQTAARLDFGLHFTGAGTAWFDAVALEPVTDTAISSTARAYLEQVLTLMQHNSIRRDSIDWVGFRAIAWEHARGTRTVTALYPVLEMMAGRLGDRHSHFVRPNPPAQAGAAMPAAELLDNRVGYLRLPEMGSADPREATAYADRLNRALRDFDKRGACGWIVDLRGNTGGNMWPMVAGLGPLAGSGTLGWFVRADGSRDPWGYEAGASQQSGEARTRVSGGDYSMRRPDAPVAILTDGRTASSGEAVAIAFRGRSNTQSFGAPTAGQSTGNQSFQLSDGARLVLTTSVMADRTGQKYGRALVPDVKIGVVGSVPPTSADTVASTARSWVEAQRPCSR